MGETTFLSLAQRLQCIAAVRACARRHLRRLRLRSKALLGLSEMTMLGFRRFSLKKKAQPPTEHASLLGIR